MTANQLLKELAIRANNTILKGHYSGDDIHEASEICRWCEKIVEAVDKEESGSTEKAD